MTRHLLILPVLVAVLGIAPAAQDDVRGDETIRRTLRFAGSGARTLDLRVITGSITVQGHDGGSVELVATRTTRADSEADAAAAGRNVTLDIADGGPTVSVIVREAPRPACGERGWNGSSRRPRYRVRVDLTVRVPRDTSLRLCSVNGGDLRVDGTFGNFDVENVNGRIDMTGIRGAGKAVTVNGPVTVTFDRNPEGDSTFRTVNGDVDIRFRDGLSADLRMKTFNGGLFTDFDVVPIPGPAGVAERRNGMFVYRGGGFTTVRAGRSGGPVMTFETLNGDVRALRQ